MTCKLSQHTLFAIICIASVFVSHISKTHAQTFPNKPVTIVVGYTPGGSVDLAARVIAPELSKRLGQPVLVDNTAGAGGQIAAQRTANATADGHTLLLGTSAEISVARYVSKAVRYDANKDLSILGLIGTQPLVLVGAPSTKANSTAELLTQLKQNPGKLSYASSGNASLPHLAGELFKQQSATFAVHIPYRGAAPMIADLMGGQVDLGLLVLSSAVSPIKAGRLKAYGTSESKRTTALPNTPALAETKGLEQFDISVFFALFVPAQTPATIKAKLSQELSAVLADPGVSAKLTEAGFNVKALDAKAAQTYIAQQEQTYKSIIEKSKINE
jgi:tripartite-type tricarboxylate transporter receptor subunit TctC